MADARASCNGDSMSAWNACFDPGVGLRLQIGSGDALIHGWLNTQKEVVDLRRSLPFPNSSCDAITISHVLMYLDIYEVAFALRDLRRIMRPDGVLRLSEPDANKIVAIARAGDLPKLHDTELVSYENQEFVIGPGRSREMQLLRYLMWSRHASCLIAKLWFTHEIITELLGDAGFTRVVKRTAATTGFVDAKICAPKLHGGDALNLYVEASH